MKVEIEISDEEVRGLMDYLGFDYDDLEVRLQCEEHIRLGMQEDFRLRDWSLADLFEGVRLEEV